MKLNSPGEENQTAENSFAPMIISGPCSAESEEQLINTALGLKELPRLDYFRAGIWKPRTRPGDFEGLGAQGLNLMQKVKELTGFRLMIEVAKPSHIEQALKHQIDAVWIGARTVVNPFSVQELAETMKGINIPVFIKNPVTPDLKLWLGAIERFHKVGITDLAAIHRGFHYFAKSPYRNAPMWEIPIELKRLLPEIPIITDISHISGKRSTLAAIAQKALDLDTDGLMIESHFDPDSAKTDAAQQIKPGDLKLLINNLKVRKHHNYSGFDITLEKLRTEIDKLDGELLQLLAKRMEIIDEIGRYKKQNNLSIFQLKRWQHILDDRLSIGTNLGLNQAFLLQMLEIVHKASIGQQEKIFHPVEAGEPRTSTSSDGA